MSITLPIVTFGELSIGDRFCRDSSEPVLTKITDTQARLHTVQERIKRTKGYGFKPELITLNRQDRVWFYPVAIASDFDKGRVIGDWYLEMIQEGESE